MFNAFQSHVEYVDFVYLLMEGVRRKYEFGNAHKFPEVFERFDGLSYEYIIHFPDTLLMLGK